MILNCDSLYMYAVVLVVPPNKVKTIWNAVLGLVDIVRGTNSYYKLQLLESDKGRYIVHPFQVLGARGDHHWRSQD